MSAYGFRVEMIVDGQPVGLVSVNVRAKNERNAKARVVDAYLKAMRKAFPKARKVGVAVIV